MDNERSTVIQIGGIDYEMILTTKATKEIAGRYGGLENLGQKLMKSENFEMALDEIVWLITLLTCEMVELLTTPLELAQYKTAIMEAMFRGTKRNVESEKDAKNAVVG